MKIIVPHHEASIAVQHFGEIKEEARALLEMVNAPMKSGRWKEAFALSHCQVSEKPYAFFCLNEKLYEEYGGHKIIINPEVSEWFEPVAFQEACCSYPFRQVINTKRYARIRVSFDVPSTLYGFPVYTGLLAGFPKQALRTVEMELTGLAAFVFQHEYDHMKGINIYDRFKK